MSYLIQQMWFCLLLAALIGAIVGWLLKKLFYRDELAELDKGWQAKLAKIESERDDLQRKLSSTTAETPITTATIAEPLAEVITPTESIAYPIEEVEGIGASYGKSIREMGITTTQELLEKCCNLEGRIQVAEKVGIEDFVVRKWASMCDLMRISGIEGQISELMVYAGIDSVQDLAQQDSERLYHTLAEANQIQNRVQSVPDISSLGPMIDQAKTLNAIMEDI